MPTPQNSDEDLETVKAALLSLRKKEELSDLPPAPSAPRRSMSIREATFSDEIELERDKALGRVLSTLTVSCPPAIPIAVPGEIIDENTIAAFSYYGIEKVKVIK